MGCMFKTQASTGSVPGSSRAWPVITCTGKGRHPEAPGALPRDPSAAGPAAQRAPPHVPGDKSHPQGVPWALSHIPVPPAAPASTGAHLRASMQSPCSPQECKVRPIPGQTCNPRLCQTRLLPPSPAGLRITLRYEHDGCVNIQNSATTPNFPTKLLNTSAQNGSSKFYFLTLKY